MLDQHQDSYMRLSQRVVRVLRTEGLAGLRSRVKERFLSHISQIHLFVLAFQLESASDSSASKTLLDPMIMRVFERAQWLLSKLEFKEVIATDVGEIDELTVIDPWHISTSVSLEKLREGWHCYVAKYEGRIVANCWTKAGPELYEPFLRRSFPLAADEVYHWRSFCVSEFQGKCVSPWLVNCIVNHLALTADIKNHVGFVRMNNTAELRTQTKTGWSIVGRLGFIEVFGLRLHYLWGRRALKATRKRFFLQLQKGQ